MTLQPILYRHNRILAEPNARTTPEDAKVIARLADSAQERALADGEHMSRKAAIARVRANLAWARAEIEKVTG